MANRSEVIPFRTVGEWTLHSEYSDKNPFADVTINATFIDPAGMGAAVTSGSAFGLRMILK